jgi:hypothetical protein
MRIEQKNLFTGEFEVVRDDEAWAAFEAQMRELALEPFECPSCEEDLIEPQLGEHYDEEEDKLYAYAYHHCFNCGFEEYVDGNDEVITDIILKDQFRQEERREHEKLYDRRLL